MNSDIFKNALGRMATGVTVISTIYNGEFFGFTSNSFSSVSLHPSLISFCLEESAHSMKAFAGSSNFAVSILSNEQEEISRHFAAHQLNKFAGISYQMSEQLQCPVINGALCWLECKKVNQYEGGDHTIFIGEVTNIIINQTQDPLIYFNGEYKSIK